MPAKQDRMPGQNGADGEDSDGSLTWEDFFAIIFNVRQRHVKLKHDKSWSPPTAYTLQRSMHGMGRVAFMRSAWQGVPHNSELALPIINSCSQQFERPLISSNNCNKLCVVHL
ncbi:hypothetical protein LSTR_LSTR002793 [Laodelphax striatellus]|uniref:Uncharacterized protein n=1 Tax=Laodelphax striatellus TaxID=195883 RepID=A0A482XIJ8_LAOST|nr:hypothetical protein LSTR_LSTR002793 [Laodelphax striatellus]